MLGGTTPQEIADLCWRESTNSRADVERFRDALIYNWVIAAPDAHAKNYSLLINGSDVHLAPLYDAISFLPYAQRDWLDLHTAMSFGDDYSVGAMGTLDAWRSAGSTMGLDPKVTADRVVDLLGRTPAAINDAIDGLSEEDRTSRVVLPLLRATQGLADQLLRSFTSAPAWGRPQGRHPQGQASSRTSSVPCGASLPSAGACGRRLLHKPCPLHPDSAGSRAVLSG